MFLAAHRCTQPRDKDYTRTKFPAISSSEITLKKKEASRSKRLHVSIPFLTGGITYCENKSTSENADEADSRPVLIKQADDIAAGKDEVLKCPGQFQDQFNRTKHLVSVDIWDGLRFDLHRSLTATFASSYNLLLGSTVVPGGNAFTFGSTLVDGNNRLLMGRMSKSGDLDARIHFPFGPTIGKITIAVGQVDQIIGTVEMNDSNSSFQLSAGSELYGFNFNQALTPRISFGMELNYLEKQKISPISLGCAYSKKNWSSNFLYTSTGSPNGMVQLQYSRSISDRTQVGAELAMNPLDPSQSIVNVGAEFNLRQSKLHFGVNGSGVVESNIEVRFLQNASLVFASQLNHVEDKHRFGFGLQMQT